MEEVLLDLKLIYEPSVYLVGRQQIDDAELSRFLADESVNSWETDTEAAGQKLVEVAGRLCYMSYAKSRPGGNSSYLGHMLEVAHGSVLEHSVFNLIITGVSRSLTHELVRHRAGWSFSQLSQRYVDESDVAFVVPPSLQEEVRLALHYLELKGGNANMAWLHAMADLDPGDPTLTGLKWVFAMIHARESYRILSDDLSSRIFDAGQFDDKTSVRKAAREAARSVLPNAAETKIFVTANARALRNFLELRGSRHADAEIRRLALKLLEVMRKEAPNIFGDYRVETLPDGRREIATDHRKV